MGDAIKLFFATLLSLLFASAQAVHHAITVLLFAFFIDMIVGILTDILIHKQRLDAKKFLLSFIYIAIYMATIISIYFVGERMDDELESLFIVKTVTYAFIYFYGANILNNLAIMFPENKAIAFLNYWFGLEFIRYIPTLGSFLNRDKKQKTEQTEETDKTENQ